MLESTLREAYDAIDLPAGWAWGWDGRFGAALMVIRPTIAEQFNGSLGAYFEQVWNHQMLTMLPQEVEALVSQLDGIRAEQQVYTKTIDQELLLWSSWWPWAGNSHISVRLGVHGQPGASERLSEAQHLLRSIFTQTL